ncbi:hypothetical protein MSAN_01215700 [Mycena sanguinolenta]|uniref:Uncharacterized protein n=1 Tax=Mycena sanguinolenta TaxID=230812 RepID=A0A8H7D474_9AGAR|nr:hypothetical protein MSAN_01215700 [Mycena sanguinolenta]
MSAATPLQPISDQRPEPISVTFAADSDLKTKKVDPVITDPADSAKIPAKRHEASSEDGNPAVEGETKQPSRSDETDVAVAAPEGIRAGSEPPNTQCVTHIPPNSGQTPDTVNATENPALSPRCESPHEDERPLDDVNSTENTREAQGNISVGLHKLFTNSWTNG